MKYFSKKKEDILGNCYWYSPSSLDAHLFRLTEYLLTSHVNPTHILQWRMQWLFLCQEDVLDFAAYYEASCECKETVYSFLRWRNMRSIFWPCAVAMIKVHETLPLCQISYACSICSCRVMHGFKWITFRTWEISYKHHNQVYLIILNYAV